MNEIDQITANVTSDGSMTVTYWGIQDGEKWNLAYYSRERVAVKVTCTKAGTLDVWFTSEIGVSYQLPVGDTMIELTDFVPMVLTADRYIRFEGYFGSGSAESVDITVSMVGAEDSNRVIIPYNPALTDTIYQVPPHAIYAPREQSVSVMLELGVLGEYMWRGGTRTAPAKYQYATVLDTVSAGDSIYMGESLVKETWRTYVKEVPCGTMYRVCAWFGRLGGEKTLIWLARGVTEEVTESQEIQAIPNANTLAFGVDVRKNYRETLTLYLPNLDAYDTYYYADIITSDSVTIDGRAVRVLSSSVTYPNGNDRGSIEVTVEYAEHDTIGL